MPSAQPGDRLKELDGIRGLAALVVAFAHYTPAKPPDPKNPYLFPFLHDLSLANVSVAIFFGLSAFLLARNAERYFDAKIFLLNRFIRICPLYLFVTVVTVIGVALLPHPEAELQKSLHSYWIYLLFLFNWRLAFGEYGFANELNHLWSLCVEMQFYLVLSFLFVAARKLRPGIYIGLVLISGTAFRIWFTSTFPNGQLYYSTFAYIEVFGLSAAAGVAHARGTNLRVPVTTGLLLAVLLLLGYLWHFVLWTGTALGTVIYPVLGALIALLLLSVTDDDGVIRRVLQFRWTRFLGAVSYGLYMWHLPIKFFLYPFDKVLSTNPVGTALAFLIYIVTCVTAAWLTYRLLEMPSNRLRKRLTLGINDRYSARSLADSR